MYTFINAASSDQFAYVLMLMICISSKQTRLHGRPGTFLGKQPLSEGWMELSLFHAELTPSEPPPTYSPPNVLLDHYVWICPLIAIQMLLCET